MKQKADTSTKYAVIRALAALLTLAVMTAWTSVIAFADEKIDKVSITVTDAGSLTAGASIGEVTVTSSDSRYYVDSARFLNDHSIWQRNERPKVRIELYAEDSYRFSYTAKSHFSVNGYGASFSFASIMDSGSYMELDIYLDRISGEGSSSQLDFNLSWSGNTAAWDNRYETESCQVRLYRWNSSGSSSSVITTKKTDEGEYDFTSYLTKSGYYTFRVRPYDAGYDTDQLWSVHSPKLYVSSDDASDNREDDFDSDYGYHDYSGGPGGGSSYSSGAYGYSTGGPGYDGSGSSYGGGPGYNGSGTSSDGNPISGSSSRWISDSNGWWYQYANGGWPFCSWQMINGRWYYFNEQGYLQTGWIALNNTWYYSFSDGSMATGWQKIGPYWYYLDNSGVLQTGWTLINSAWYYLDPGSGAMWAGCFTPDGHYVNANGVRLY
ncbi:MAG: hypothetical protein Q4C66_03990 [Lachnospiraceae bacterium]|nr:hypothetical protein [Lachnospiraceae bacterium]